MYEPQEDNIQLMAVETESFLAEGRARLDGAIRVSQRESHQAVARLRWEACCFVAHESSAYRDHSARTANRRRRSWSSDCRVMRIT